MRCVMTGSMSILGQFLNYLQKKFPYFSITVGSLVEFVFVDLNGRTICNFNYYNKYN